MSIVIVVGSNERNFEMTPAVIQPTTGTLTGVVTDATTGLPINGVTVSLSGVTTTTDSGGNYGFTNITPGTYTLTFTKAGYITVTV
jgi:large repetitive protein